MTQKTQIFIVRSGSGFDAPESYIHGLYPTKELALARIDALVEEEYIYDTDAAWIDTVMVGPQGADCNLCNR
jgi:hypothetical protein